MISLVALLAKILDSRYCAYRNKDWEITIDLVDKWSELLFLLKGPIGAYKDAEDISNIINAVIVVNEWPLDKINIK